MSPKYARTKIHLIMGEDRSSSSEIMQAEQFMLDARKSRELISHYLAEEKPGRAFAHFLVVFTLQPECRFDEEFKDSFIATLCAWGQSLEAAGSLDHVIECYQQALDIYPENEEILNNLGTHALRCGSFRAARGYYLRALASDPHFLPAARNLQHANDGAVERWHYRMLNDRQRNEAFRRAVTRRVRQGHDRVLDIGAGTGILSVFALAAGAKDVTACDYSSTMVEIAKKVLGANGADRVRLLERLSTDLIVPRDMPQRVSIVVTETLDAGAFGEGILQTLLHAWDHLLLPPCPFSATNCQPPSKSLSYGVVVPNAVSLFICGIQCGHLSRKNAFVKSDLLILPGDYVRDTNGEPYDTEDLRCIPGGFECLTDECVAVEVDFNSRDSIALALQGDARRRVELRCKASGRLDAIAAWFRLIMDEEGEVLSSHPDSEEGCWDQAIFPLLPIECRAGDIVLVDVCSDGGKVTATIAGSKTYKTASEEMIRFANDTAMLESLKMAVERFSGQLIDSVIDFLPLPMFGIELSKRSTVDCVTFVARPKDEAALIEVAHLNGVSNATFASSEDSEPFAADGTVDVIVVDLVDPAGELRVDVVGQLPLLRAQLKPAGMLLPARVTVCCQLVQCEWLDVATAVMDDERTCGCRVAEFINCYQSDLQLDFSLSSTVHTALSNPIECSHLNLADPADQLATHTLAVMAITAGRVNAVAVWYVVRWLDEDVGLSTHRAESCVGQAAFMLRPAMGVVQGQTVNLRVGYVRGVLAVAVQSVSPPPI